MTRCALILLLVAGLVPAVWAQAPEHPGCAVWSNAENRCLQVAPTAAAIAACTVWSKAENRCLEPEDPAAAIARRTEQANAFHDYVQEKIRQVLANATPIAPQLQASPTKPPVTITQKCAKDWPTDFKMQAFCQKTQVEALGQLATRHQGNTMQSGAGATIRATCAQRWPNDFKMANFCEEQQLKALASNP